MTERSTNELIDRLPDPEGALLRALDAHYDAREPVTALRFAVYLPAKRLADTGAD